jgi:hypothetical protein
MCIGVRVDGDWHCGELGQRIITIGESMRLRRIAICSPLPTSNRQRGRHDRSGFGDAVEEFVRGWRGFVFEVPGKSVTDASMTTLIAGLR